MNYFMTDIHGEYEGVVRLFEHAGVDWTRDRVVFGGDYINRGKYSSKVLRYIKELVQAHPDQVTALAGNHEEMMLDYYRLGDKLWLSHGGRETLKELNKALNPAEMEEYLEWLGGLPITYQDDHFVYTHAGLNPYEPLDKQSRDILWMTESEFYSITRETLFALTDSKPVVHGHTPVERIYYDGIRLNGDLGCSTYFIEEERGLALLNLSEMVYYVYKQLSKTIEERTIARF